MSRRFRTPDDGLEPVRAALRADPAGVAEAILGPPNLALSSRRQHRYGTKGGIAVEVSGPKRGLWIDHSAGEGGDLLALIQREQRCSFSEAVAWARTRTGIAGPEPLAPKHRRTPPEPPPQPPPPDPDTASADVDNAAKDAADQARRIAFAERLADESAPLAGTLGETYLRQTRGIRCPADGWPASIRWHPGHQALLAIATLPDESVRAAQRIHLDTDAEKIGRDELARRGLRAVKQTSGVLRAAVVRLPGDPTGPLLLAEGVETGLAAHTTGYETWIALGSVASLEPPIGRPVLVAADDDAAGSPAATALDRAVQRWRQAGADVTVAHPWTNRRHDKRDFANLILTHGPDAVRERINHALAAAKPASPHPSAVPTAPHYPRGPQHNGMAAGRRLRRAMAAFMDRVERYLAIRDWIAAEAERTLPEVRALAEARIYARRMRRHQAELDEFDNGERDPAETAAEWAVRVAPRVARNAARRAAIAKFGRRHGACQMPRFQFRGAAGLGKTQALVDEYLRRPSLWKRNIEFYSATLDLGNAFADSIHEAALTTPPTLDGTRPRAVLIQGRDTENCHPERLPIVRAAANAKIDSIYRACCHMPAFGFRDAISCPHLKTCNYIKQFDNAPALRIMPHARARLRQPDDLPLPSPDLVVIDETTIGTLVAYETIEPSALTERKSYADAPDFGDDYRISAAVEAGQAVIDALAGGGEAMSALSAAGITRERLREAAAAARRAAGHARPSINPATPAEQVKERLRHHTPHPGRQVAAVLDQLARDQQAGRRQSVSVEWDPAHAVKLDDGKRTLHPVIRHHAIVPTPRISPHVALLLLDADADLTINRRLFGPSLRELSIGAARQAHVVQISDAALAKSTLAPGPGLPNNQVSAKRLRARIAQFVAAQVQGDRRVLVVAPLQVRRALTGEAEEKLPPTTKWLGADVLHFGRHLGIDSFRQHDTVILIGREQLPPLDAERIARAIHGDDPHVTLNLPGGYVHELRRHDLRIGLAPPVPVQVHADRQVQRIVELHREQALAQAIDRLRLVHRDPANPAQVFLLTNLPIPGLVIDELMSLDQTLDGGSIWDRALARCGGVLPLTPGWLTRHLPELFPSLRSAQRAVANFRLPPDKPPLRNKRFYCEMAVYKLAGQRRPSKVLVRNADVADPRAALAHLLGAEIQEFRWFDEDGPVPASSADVPPTRPETENSFRARPPNSGAGERQRPPSSRPPKRCKDRHSVAGKHAQNGGLTRNDLAALAQSKGGVLPLTATWLMTRHADLFPSRRTTERLLAEVTADTLPPGYRLSLYRPPGQHFPSRALVRGSLKNPRAALERTLGVRLKEFKMITPTGGKADTLDGSTSTRERTARDAPEGVAREVIGGYGPLLDPSAMFSQTAGPAPPAMLLTVRGRAVGW